MHPAVIINLETVLLVIPKALPILHSLLQNRSEKFFNRSKEKVSLGKTNEKEGDFNKKKLQFLSTHIRRRMFRHCVWMWASISFLLRQSSSIL